MRIKLTLTQTKPKQLIPSSYHHAVASFIYRTIEKSDPQYSQWLHSKGFQDGNKKFKFFNFSDFYIPERNFMHNKIEILSNNFTLNVSMLSDQTTEHLIIGMFQSGKMKIFDNQTVAEFNVKFIETVPEPDFNETMRYRILTPVVLSKKILKNEKDYVYYLEPGEDDYNLYFVNNLLAKYKIYSGAEIINPQAKFEFKILSDFKKELRTLITGENSESKIRGYKYEFELKAPPDIHRMLWMSGIGIKNSMGFGFVGTAKK